MAEDLPRMCKGLDLPKTEGKVTEGILHPIHYDWAEQQGIVHETRISFYSLELELHRIQNCLELVSVLF